jgi:hypothetical protein
VSSVDQAVIDLVEGVPIWGVPGLELYSFVHEVRTLDRHRITVALQYYRLYCQVVRIAGVQDHVRGLEGPSRGLYGFVKSRSTVSNLIEYSSFVLKSLEKDCHVDSIYTDFSKAFDRERNCLLLDKMSMVVLSLPAVSGCVLTFLVKSSA